MKCIGKAKFLNMNVEEKRTTGKIYFSTKVGNDFETDFINVVLVGKAHQFVSDIARFDDLEKLPIFITESQLRIKSGKREDGSFWYYNEMIVFDFEEVREEEPSLSIPVKPTKRVYSRYK